MANGGSHKHETKTKKVNKATPSSKAQATKRRERKK
jgi:hypothetical protein